ncbi:hypothetical protein BDU57DRAFT_523480 [Ampelomyces quisqualis]|uniref:Uncharacterized protein n=1 Tax=Ampelomyces quisqualis TaxID=50730 RepID=A0A6A5Q9T3_AMPQU|nr:hypothetical protein BDU57DRAFT_523480 [Ampelomyces quisqualis]
MVCQDLDPSLASPQGSSAPCLRPFNVLDAVLVLRIDQRDTSIGVARIHQILIELAVCMWNAVVSLRRGCAPGSRGVKLNRAVTRWLSWSSMILSYIALAVIPSTSHLTSLSLRCLVFPFVSIVGPVALVRCNARKRLSVRRGGVFAVV